MRKMLWIGAGLLGAAAAAWVFDNYSGYVAGYVYKRRYPDIRTPPSPLGKSLELDNRQRRIDAFNAESRRIALLVEQAAQKGLDVGGLRERLARAVRLAEDGRFRDAGIMLNIIEIRLPRQRESVRPVDEDEPPPPEPPIEGKAVRRSRRAK
ncbi:MAG: hypothetical protein HY922_10705 [Elusimicrobia bacterium]|nr:hypothetical protein [Elusimicrobiota bacterium]